MANRRMVNIRVIDSDKFLELPLSSQALYFHLLMRADDDGFINNPKRIQRMIGSSEDDFKLLLAKQYIISFDSGVIVIKHWKMHNYIKKDRYQETECRIEKSMLYEENKTYTLEKPPCIQDGDILEPERNHRLGKVSLELDKGSIDNNILPEQAGQQSQEQQQILENDSNSNESTQLYQGVREYHMPLKDGSDYVVTENDVLKYKQLYPKLDIDEELRQMIAWLKSNKQRQKTKRGMPRFMNGWLNKSYVQFVKEPKARANVPKQQIQHNFTQRDYDFDDLEQQLLRKQQEGM